MELFAVHFYVKMVLLIAILALVVHRVVLTIDGVNKGLRTITPATVTIYSLFVVTALIAITLAVLNYVMLRNLNSDTKLQTESFILLEVYEVFYWAI